MFNAPGALLVARAVSGERARAHAPAAPPSPRTPRRSNWRRAIRAWASPIPAGHH